MEERLNVEGMSVVALRPDDWDSKTAVILGHGAGQNMDSAFMSFFHEGLAGLGVLAVKFNFPYMEAGRKLPDRQPKLRASYETVIRRILETFGPDRLVIGGKSMGGRVASYIAGGFEDVRGLIFLGYPLHPPGRTDKLRDDHLYALDRPMLFVSGARDALARRDLLEDVAAKIGPRATINWIEEGDHSLRVRKSDPDGLARALAAIDDWIGKL